MDDKEVDETVEQMMKGLEGQFGNDPKQLEQFKAVMRQQIRGYAGLKEQLPETPENQKTVVDPAIVKRVTAKQFPDLPVMGDADRIDFDRTYNSDEHERMGYGLSPASMDEKWIMILEGDMLRMWRSWSPNPCVYQVTMKKVGSSYRTTEVLVAKEFMNKSPKRLSYVSELLDYLIQRLLLGHAATFPFPEDVIKPMDRMMLRHGLVGSSMANGEG